MINSNNVLIICRDLKSVRRFSNFKPQAKSRYILAADDPRVHEAAKKYSWIGETCWIEQMESFFKVANDVFAFIDIINPWLELLGDDKNGIPADLLFWIKHAEGGMTTQRIQDMLLLIRSYLHLFESNNITDIVIFSHPDMRWEDDVLIETARSRNINIKVIGSKHPNVLMGKVLASFKFFARDPYYILKFFLRAKLYSLFRLKKESIEKEIVFQFLGSDNKHLAHTIPLVKSLKNKGYNPVVLCWRGVGGAKKVRKMGFRAEVLEKYGPLSSIWEGGYRVLHTWRKALARKEELFSHPELQYRSVSLGNLLWPSIQSFITGELPHRYRLMRAIKRYYALHSPVAIRFWTHILPEGVIPLRNLTKKNKPLIFSNLGFHDQLNFPSQNKHYSLDLTLAFSTTHKKKLEHLGISSDKIVTIGQVSWEQHLDLQKKYTQDQSLSFLKIPSNYSNYILYDSGSVLRGYLGVREQVETTTLLLDFAKEHPSIAIIIKPHPGHKQGILESLVDTHSLENIFIIDEQASFFHCINATDFLITKFSAGGIEAMHLKKPVISVILDREKKFRIYADAAEYANDIGELNKLLKRVITDDNYRVQWTANLNNKATQYLADILYRPLQVLPSELGADAIIRFIEKRKKEKSLDRGRITCSLSGQGVR